MDKQAGIGKQYPPALEVQSCCRRFGCPERSARTYCTV